MDTLVTTEFRPEVNSLVKYALKKDLKISSHVKVESWSIAVRLARLGFGCCLVPDFVAQTGLKVVRASDWRETYQSVIYLKNVSALNSLELSVIEGLGD